jgi:hypothetical protein
MMIAGTLEVVGQAHVRLVGCSGIFETAGSDFFHSKEK